MSNGARVQISEGVNRERPRLLFLGRPCPLSAIPLQTLLAHNMPPLAVFVPARWKDAPALRQIHLRAAPALLPLAGRDASPSIRDVLRNADCPMFEIASLKHADVVDHVRAMNLDLIVTSCFPWFVPNQIRSLARYGGVNLHPSLLPRFRGPDPLFWMFRCGVDEAGVTIHRLSNSFDAGPVLGQQQFGLEDGITGDDLELRCAEHGGHLLVDVISQLWNEEARESLQVEANASYQSWPAASDLHLDRAWSVRRVRNFVQGVLPLGYRPIVDTAQGSYEIMRINQPGHESREGIAKRDSLGGTELLATFSDGTVHFQVLAAAATS